jgi:hypothetical protein
MTVGLKSRRRAPADARQADIASKRRMCTAFERWRACGRPSCRRLHVCFGDPLACFARFWSGHPKAFHAWIVAAGDARATGLTMRQAMRVADSQVRDGSGCAAFPWVRPYLQSFDELAPTSGSRGRNSTKGG